MPQAISFTSTENGSSDPTELILPYVLHIYSAVAEGRPSMNPDRFVDELRRLHFENTFNPYSDRCVDHDLHDAPKLRSQTLLRAIEAAAASDVDAIWVGRDLGYRGGRRTGLAFTDDVRIHDYAKRWRMTIRQPTTDTCAESTAKMVWSVLRRIAVPVFLWNVFPLHPHEPGNPFSNRKHNKVERKEGERLLAHLIDILEPRRLIAIGKDAGKVVSTMCVESVVVRHPSHGGQSCFRAQVYESYD